MFRVCARNYHSYAHLKLALGIIREPTAHMTLAGLTQVLLHKRTKSRVVAMESHLDNIDAMAVVSA